MSRNIDEIITAYGQLTSNTAETEPARAELAALRDSEKNWRRQAETQRANAAGQRARAELAEEQLQHEQRTVAEQARQLAQARDIFVELDRAYFESTSDAWRMVEAWLAANAPEDHYLSPGEIDAAVTEAHQSEERADAWLAAHVDELIDIGCGRAVVLNVEGGS